ncbi:hypothetical protein AHAS_Ahas16G0187400 [Arachis hypogaea]
MLQSHKMSKRIIWDIAHHHKMIQQPNQWGYALESQIDQANHMRYCPEPQNDLCHYPYGVWAYQQECEQSSEINFLPEPQSDSYCYDSYTNHGWEGNFNDSYSTHQETSSMECAFNKFMQNCPLMPQDDSYCDEFNNSSSCAWRIKTRMHLTIHTPLIKSYHHLSKTFNSLMESCQTSPPSFSSENSSSLNYPLTQNLFQNS